MNDLNRINKIKALGFNPHTIWYHGSTRDFEKFGYHAIGDGEDAHGPGFYFTDNPETANQYTKRSPNTRANNAVEDNPTPVVYPVHLKLTKGMNENTKFTRNQIQKIITTSPSFNDDIQNFGDVSYEGLHKVLKGAVDTYAYNTGHHLLNLLKNDFFKNHTEEFLKAVTKHTGYDHMNCNNGYLENNPHESWVVVFHPHQIRSIHAEFNPEKSQSGNLLEEKLAKKKDKKVDNSKKSFKDTLISTIRKKRGDYGRTEVKVNGKSTIIINPQVKDITTEYNVK